MRYTFLFVFLFLVNLISAQTDEEKVKNANDVMNYMKDRGYDIPTTPKAPEVPTSNPQTEYLKATVPNYKDNYPTTQKMRSSHVSHNYEIVQSDTTEKSVSPNQKSESLYYNKAKIEEDNWGKFTESFKDNRVPTTEYVSRDELIENNQSSSPFVIALIFAGIIIFMIMLYFLLNKNTVSQSISNISLPAEITFNSYKFTEEILFKQILSANLTIESEYIKLDILPFLNYSGKYKIVSSKSSNRGETLFVTQYLDSKEYEEDNYYPTYVITLSKSSNKVKIFDKDLKGIILKT